MPALNADVKSNLESQTFLYASTFHAKVCYMNFLGIGAVIVKVNTYIRSIDFTQKYEDSQSWNMFTPAFVINEVHIVGRIDRLQPKCGLHR